MYLPELSVIKLLLNKDIYYKYISYIDLKYIKDTYKELYYIYSILEQLHSMSESPTLSDLRGYFFVIYPDADKDTYSELFKRLESESVGDDVAEGMLKEIKRRKDALNLSETLFKLSQGQEVKDNWEHKMSDFLKGRDDHQNLSVVTTDLEALIHATYQDQGLRWRLNCLNKSLGSLRKGDFGFIFARPETGKTTFLASETTNFITGNKAKIVWFNNEEQGNKVMIRVYQAYFGVPMDVLMSNVKKFKKAFEEQVGDRFHMYDSASIGKRDVERVVEEVEPDLVVYDQIDKIKGFSNDREDLRLGSIYQWGRELAKNSHAAIGVCQADGTAEGVRYLTMEHVANAKTAKQAEADWILGIGKTHDEALQRVRYLNISKNKLFGDPDSIADLKHGRFETLINPAIARYEDVVTYA